MPDHYSKLIGEIEPEPVVTVWGNWTHDGDYLVLSKGVDRTFYEVDLRTMQTPAAMLDWIFQVSNKTWMKRDDVGDLIAALEAIFHPQSTMVSCCLMSQGEGYRRKADTA